MSTNPNKARGEKRRRKSRFSNLASRPRKRTWVDLIEITTILQKEGVMPVKAFLKEGDASPTALLEANAKSLSMLTSISEQGAFKCLKIASLHRNEDLWSFLTSSFRFPIFQDSALTSGYGPIRTSGGTISLDLVEALVQSRDDSPVHQSNIAVPKSKPKKLDSIVSKFSPEARDTLLLFFLKQVTVISTICSFFPNDFGPDTYAPGIRGAAKNFVADKLSRFISPDWSKEEMQSISTHCSRCHMVDGWHIVNEVMKVQLQEIMFASEKKMETTSMPHSITKEDVLQAGNDVVSHVVSELAGWLFIFFRKEETTDRFLQSLYYLLNQVFSKLLIEVGCPSDDDIDEDILVSAVDHISRGGPTMAQIRYNASKFVPTMRKHRISSDVEWDAKSVLLRCRPTETVALQKYSSFLAISTTNTAFDLEF